MIKKRYNYVTTKLYFILLPIFFILLNASDLEIGENDKSSKEAIKHLQVIENQSKHINYGKCWTEALLVLRSGCRNLSDEVQRQIAYAFTRCHLQNSGREISKCQSSEISECIKMLPDFVFNTYTLFFTHSQQICFHLQSQIWHESTEKMIGHLVQNSEKVAENLLKSSQMTEEIAEKQQFSLQNQKQMLQIENSLQKHLKESYTNLQQVMNQHSVYFTEFFSQISSLQATLLGEFTNSSSIFYNLLSLLCAFLLTASSRTSSARLPLICICVISFFVERILIPSLCQSSWFIYLSNPFIRDQLTNEDKLFARLWFCRKIFCFLAIVVFFYKLITYKNYDKVNHQILSALQNDNQQIHQQLQALTNEIRNRDHLNEMITYSLFLRGIRNNVNHSSSCLDSNINRLALADEVDDDSDDDSFDGDDIQDSSSDTSSDKSCIVATVQSFSESQTQDHISSNNSVPQNPDVIKMSKEDINDEVLIGGYSLRKRK